MLDITPEPTSDERDAIVAAFAVLAEVSIQEADRSPETSRWRAAAKRESLRSDYEPQAGRNPSWKCDPGPAISGSRSGYFRLDR